MDAPLYNALCVLRGQKGLRMHMPGHKGKSPAAEFSTAAALDYTEIDPTGNLYTGLFPHRRLHAGSAGGVVAVR